MPTLAQKVAVLFGLSYSQKLVNLFGSSIVSYLPNPATGVDIGGRGYNGAPTAATSAPGIGDGGLAGSFDGSTSFVNWYSAGLAGAFSGAAGSLLGWFKMSAAGDWTNGAAKRLANIQVDANNIVQIRRSVTDNTLTYIFNAGAGANNLTINSTGLGGRLGFCPVALAWNKAADRLTAYELGAAVAAPTTGLGTWAGSPGATTTVLGALNTSVSVPWIGFMAHWLLLNREASASDIQAFSVI